MKLNRKFLSMFCVLLVFVLSVGFVCATESGNCYTKIDGKNATEIDSGNDTDVYASGSYSYDGNGSSIKNKTNTVEIDTESISDDYNIDTGHHKWSVTNNGGQDLTKYIINKDHYNIWVQEELNNTDIQPNKNFHKEYIEKMVSSGRWFFVNDSDGKAVLIPYVIKNQSDGIHIDHIKVLEPKLIPIINLVNGMDIIYDNKIGDFGKNELKNVEEKLLTDFDQYEKFVKKVYKLNGTEIQYNPEKFKIINSIRNVFCQNDSELLDGDNFKYLLWDLYEYFVVEEIIPPENTTNNTTVVVNNNTTIVVNNTTTIVVNKNIIPMSKNIKKQNNIKSADNLIKMQKTGMSISKLSFLIVLVLIVCCCIGYFGSKRLR